MGAVISASNTSYEELLFYGQLYMVEVEVYQIKNKAGKLSIRRYTNR